MLSYIGILLVSLFLFVSFRKRNKNYNFPSGPTPIPLLGNIHQILNKPHIQLSKWAKKYGSLYTIRLPGKTVVVANDLKTMKSLCGCMESTGHYDVGVLDDLCLGKYGIVNSEGHAWAENHQFLTQQMTRFGFGSANKLDVRILQEVDEVCRLIKFQMQNESSYETTIELTKILLRCTGNVIWNMVVSKQTKSEGSTLVESFMHWIDCSNRITKSGVIFFPWLKYVAAERCGYNKFTEACKEIRKHMDKTFVAHEISRVKGDIQRDIIDACLDKVAGCKDPNNMFYGSEGLKHCKFNILGLMLGGSETTSGVLKWLIFYLAVHENVQQKLQAEIDQVVGKTGLPSLFFRHRMPYLEAVVHETLRKSSLLGFGILHRLLEDVCYEGYCLPKDTVLLANVYHVNHDPHVWKDPHRFRPERFLEGDDNQRKGLRESISSFQNGRGRYIGEQFGKDVLFLAAARLFQKFSFHIDPKRETLEYLETQVSDFLNAPILPLVVRTRE